MLVLTVFGGMRGLAQDVPKVDIPVGFSIINVHPSLTPVTSFNAFGVGDNLTSTSETHLPTCLRAFAATAEKVQTSGAQ
jgi:hypothetical protein